MRDAVLEAVHGDRERVVAAYWSAAVCVVCVPLRLSSAVATSPCVNGPSPVMVRSKVPVLGSTWMFDKVNVTTLEPS